MDDGQQQLDALRAADWQYRLARHLVSEKRFVSHRRYGASVQAIADYLHQEANRSNSGDCCNHRAPDGLPEAFAVRQKNPWLALAIEALVLSGTATDEIAQLLGVSLESATWYESAFFDVRDRLASAGFVLQLIERAREQDPPDYRDFGWKLVAYRVGVEALLQVLGAAKCESLSELASAQRSVTNHALQETLVEAAVNQFGMAPAEAARVLRLGQDAKPDPDKFEPSEYQANIKAYLDEHSWSMGRYPPHPAFDKFRNCAAELKADELQIIASGGTLPNEEAILNLQLPPPRHAREEST